MPRIKILLFSYKNKKLQEIIDNTYSTSDLKDFEIKVFDQSNIMKHFYFKDYDGLDYLYVNWDATDSQCKKKKEEIENCNNDFVLIMSDDVWLEPKWDTRLIEFAADRSLVISGRETARLSHKDRYSIKNSPVPSDDFNLSQYIDRNFIFARTEILKNVGYPPKLKLYGEEEMLSINILSSEDIDIYNAPGDLYTDLKNRNLENLYTTFSKYHNFNNVYRAIQSGRAENFLKYHKLDKDLYFPTPDLINDVEYDAQETGFFTDSARKFIDPINVLIPGEGVVK
jgi:hypothetical protein